MKKRVAIISVLLISVVGALFGFNRFHPNNSWDFLNRMKASDVYYACVCMKGYRVIFFEQEDLDEFAALMNDLKIQPTFRDPQEFEQEGCGFTEWFVFERKAQKGAMIRVQLSEIKKDGRQMYLVWLNEEVYEIEEEVHDRIEAFIERFV